MACRNRRWPIHRLSSTSVRCMTAIWPAGPPKVCSEMANQVRTAVRKGMGGLPRRPGGSLVTEPPSAQLLRQAGGHEPHPVRRGGDARVQDTELVAEAAAGPRRRDDAGPDLVAHPNHAPPGAGPGVDDRVDRGGE